MNSTNDTYQRYVYEVVDEKYVYVGISINPATRMICHKRDPIKKPLFCNIRRKFKCSKPLPLEAAICMEKSLIKKHRAQGVRTVLNRSKGGEFGKPGFRETIEQIMEKAWGLTRDEFRDNYRSSFNIYRKLKKEERVLIDLVMNWDWINEKN